MRGTQGFTFIELVVIMAIISILTAIAIPMYQDSVLKAKEAVLKDNLWHLRDALNQFKADRGVYPQDLSELVERQYLRDLPLDPFTGEHETWIPIYAEPLMEDYEDLENLDQGIEDVQSGAEGIGSNGIPFSEW